MQNAHGDVVNLTDADGAVIKSYTYDAFGVEKNIDDTDTNAFRYCGEYYDAETGTVYLRARYYNPSAGRFISRDSYRGRNGNPLSLNLYTYCANNPLLYFDPSGHSFAYLPDGTKRSMDNPWDVKQFYKLRGEQLANGVESKNDTSSSRAPGCGNGHYTPGCSLVTSVTSDRVIYIPEKVNGIVNGISVTLSPQENWFAYQGTEIVKDSDGRYKVVVGPKILDPNYSDDGKIYTEDFNFPITMDAYLVDKSSGKTKIIECVTYEGAK
ncbi:MAG: RHS repeat-associated core domain-containing protein, partial [Oscillospiraceae bacterium]|nr:RHS repeat-associated core domain-containing protein [Oscillospiraceae bacterium]